MTKDDVTAEMVVECLTMTCGFCGDAPECQGCIVEDAAQRVNWLEAQRQQTARERGEE